MNRAEVLEAVRVCIHNSIAAAPTTIEESSRFSEDLALTSLDVIEIVCALEDQLATRVDLAALVGASTIGDLIDVFTVD